MRRAIRWILVTSLLMLALPLHALWWCDNVGTICKEFGMDCGDWECWSPWIFPVVELKHTEGYGVGFHGGYTTGEIFAGPYDCGESYIPLVDLRGHVFNDGSPAANVGFGARQYFCDLVWGANIFYDYRSTHHHRAFNQLGFGIEVFSEIIDFRSNAYFPFSRTKSEPFEVHGKEIDGEVIFTSKHDFAFRGFDAEVGGFLFDHKMSRFNLYGAVGGYYFTNRHISPNAVGGYLRLETHGNEYFRIEVETSYDRLFRWQTHGKLVFSMPLGWLSGCATRDCKCCTPFKIYDKFLQPFRRHEMIVVKKGALTRTFIEEEIEEDEETPLIEIIP